MQTRNPVPGLVLIKAIPVITVLWGLLGTTAGCIADAPITASREQALPFPASDADWLPVTQASIGMGDVFSDAQGDSRNVVGSSQFPAVFLKNDGEHLFFRLRVNSNPIANNGNLVQFAWGVLLEADGDLTQYEYLLILDASGNNDSIRYGYNRVRDSNRPGDPGDSAEHTIALIPVVLSATDPGRNVMVTQADTCFKSATELTCNSSTDPARDYFLSVGLPLTTFTAPSDPNMLRRRR